jgi:hypothetical protein
MQRRRCPRRFSQKVPHPRHARFFAMKRTSAFFEERDFVFRESDFVDKFHGEMQLPRVLYQASSFF